MPIEIMFDTTYQYDTDQQDTHKADSSVERAKVKLSYRIICKALVALRERCSASGTDVVEGLLS